MIVASHNSCEHVCIALVYLCLASILTIISSVRVRPDYKSDHSSLTGTLHNILQVISTLLAYLTQYTCQCACFRHYCNIKLLLCGPQRLSILPGKTSINLMVCLVYYLCKKRQVGARFKGRWKVRDFDGALGASYLSGWRVLQKVVHTTSLICSGLFTSLIPYSSVVMHQNKMFFHHHLFQLNLTMR